MKNIGISEENLIRLEGELSKLLLTYVSPHVSFDDMADIKYNVISDLMKYLYKLLGKDETQELKIYCLYSKHTCHDSTDDCAICFAKSMEDAYEKFIPLYEKTKYSGCITEARFNKFEVAILGDY